MKLSFEKSKMPKTHDEIEFWKSKMPKTHDEIEFWKSEMPKTHDEIEFGKSKMPKTLHRNNKGHQNCQKYCIFKVKWARNNNKPFWRDWKSGNAGPWFYKGFGKFSEKKVQDMRKNSVLESEPSYIPQQ